jgi:hypothetical protein
MHLGGVGGRAGNDVNSEEDEESIVTRERQNQNAQDAADMSCGQKLGNET